MTTELQNIASFARRYNIAAADAYVLPAVFERAAALVGLPRQTLTERALLSRELGDYLASVALSVLRSLALEELDALNNTPLLVANDNR